MPEPASRPPERPGREPSAAVLAWACRQLGPGARAEAWMRLRGGTACRVDALDLRDARGLRHALVLKRFVRADWVARDPGLVRREAEHLRWLEAVDLPLPRVVAVDPDGGECGVPALLSSRLPGRVRLEADDLDAWLRGLAETLARLHEIGGWILERLGPWRSYVDVAALAVPGWSRRPQVWERALARLQAGAPSFVPRFVHRDYHPGNLLWTGARVTGVLDFNDSCCGAAALDLGHCRLNLVQLHGPETADRFARLYEEVAPGVAEPDPYWDLLSLVQVLPGPDEVYPGWSGRLAARLDLARVHARLDAWAAGLVARLA